MGIRKQLLIMGIIGEDLGDHFDNAGNDGRKNHPFLFFKAPMKRSRWLKIVALIVVLGGVGALLYLVPLKTPLLRFLEWSQSLGMWAPVVIGLSYLPAAVLFLPGSVLTIGAGLVCGLLPGTIAVSLGSTSGASLAFIVGRTIARKWIESKVAANPNFQAIDAAVGSGGFKIVLLTRLSPVFPFNVLNYAYGLSRVRFRDYLIGSWLGMLPGTVMYVYIGSSLKSLAELASGKVQGGAAQKALFAAGLVATIVVALYVARLARKELRKAVPEELPQDAPKVSARG
jgi:uncharacterized membrane protein YdjX (TVP38/TMEM64 family)